MDDFRSRDTRVADYQLKVKKKVAELYIATMQHTAPGPAYSASQLAITITGATVTLKLVAGDLPQDIITSIIDNFQIQNMIQVLEEYLAVEIKTVSTVPAQRKQQELAEFRRQRAPLLAEITAIKEKIENDNADLDEAQYIVRSNALYVV